MLNTIEKVVQYQELYNNNLREEGKNQISLSLLKYTTGLKLHRLNVKEQTMVVYKV
jgi:hypothetical protein